MKMNNLIVGVGDDPIDVSELVSLISNSSSYPLLKVPSNWKIFVRNLDIQDISSNSAFEEIDDRREPLYELLHIWCEEKGKGATLSVLIDSLPNCSREDISDLLEEKYWLLTVKTLQIQVSDKVVTLEEIARNISEESYIHLYSELKKGTYAEPIELLRKDRIPQVDSNYIHRKLQYQGNENQRVDLSEEDFLSKVQNDSTIIISGPSGIGKTNFIANIATKYKANDGHSIVIFVHLDDFAKVLKDPVYVPAALAEYAGGNEVARIVLEEVLNASSSRCIDLFLDGYDQVCTDKLDIVDAFLCELKKRQKFRVFVSTRVNLKPRLEDVLRIPAYELIPFSKLDRIRFLTSYWAVKLGINPSAELRTRAEQCLETLEVKSANTNIVEIPSQCRILADAFMQEVEKTLKTETTTYSLIDVLIQFDTADFHKFLRDWGNYISIKGWISGNVKTEYVHTHVYEALALCFPDWIEKFKPHLLGFDQVDSYTLYSMGLMKKVPSKNTPKFEIPEVAEYVLAEYLVKNLDKHRECIELLFGVILQAGDLEENPGEYPSNIKVYGLKYPTMSCFVNKFLGDGIENGCFDELSMSAIIEWMDPTTTFWDLCKIIELCGIHQLEACLDFALKLMDYSPLGNNTLTDLMAIRDTHFKYLPLLAVERCISVTLVKKLLHFTNTKLGVDLTFHQYKAHGTTCKFPWINGFTPIHMAVYCGNSEVVFSLIRKYDPEIKNLKYLLHMCLRNSLQDNYLKIESKHNILGLLCFVAKEYGLDWFDERLDNLKPSEEHLVHPRLLERLRELEQRESAPWFQFTGINISTRLRLNSDKSISRGMNDELITGSDGIRPVNVLVKRRDFPLRPDESVDLIRERLILPRCDDHENIASLYSTGLNVSNGTIEYRLVIDSCESNLKEFVENRERCLEKLGLDAYAAPTPLDLVRQIILAFSHLHSNNIALMKLDPETVLLKSCSGGRVIVKLSGFDSSNIILPGLKTCLTKNGFDRNVRWIAPELEKAIREQKDQVSLTLTLNVDIYPLACLIYYVLSGGKELFQFPFDPLSSPLYNYKLKIEFSALGNNPSHYPFVHLIPFMALSNERDRPSIKDVENHFAFFRPDKQILFLMESFFIDKESKDLRNEVEEYLKQNHHSLAGAKFSNLEMIYSQDKEFEKGWSACIDEIVFDAFANQNQNKKNRRTYNRKSSIELLQGIRNLRAHFGEKHENVQKLFGEFDEDYVNYWHSERRFPFCLVVFWRAFQPKIRNSKLEKYYKGIQYDFSKILDHENECVI